MKRLRSGDRHSLLRSCRLLVRKTKRLIEFIAYGFFDALILMGCSRQENSKTVAIVHLELLGDYVLWLPYGRAMVRHFQRHDHQVVLVLNEAVLPLAQRHFTGCTLIGIDRVAFVRNLMMRIKFLRQLRWAGASMTFHSSYPRDAIIGDAVVRALAAPPALGFGATFIDRPWLDRWLSSQLYNRLLPPIPGVHQSRRHHAFVRAIGIASSGIETPADFASGRAILASKPYFIIAPGASRSEKSWPVQSFVAVAQHMLATYSDWQCVVVGSRSEYELGETMAEILGPRVNNLTGSTDVVELAAWIAHAQLVVGNDSAVCHIAAACGVRSIAVVGGGHYGRCYPYDPNEARIRRLPVTISESMDCFGCDWICRYPVAKGMPYPCITAISTQQVCAEVDKLLLAQEYHDRR